MKTIIYGLSDPITNELRYVGKTKRSLSVRIGQHIYEAKRCEKYSSRWINSLLKKGTKPTLVELEVVDGDWREAEQFWIAYWKFLGARLTNHTIGGDGSNGVKASQATRAKMRASKLGKKTRPHTDQEKIEISNRLLGHTVSEVTRSKIGNANRGRAVSAETREKLRLVHLGKKKPPRTKEHARKIIEARTRNKLILQGVA